MSWFRKERIADFRADYATRADFSEILAKDMERLYLLAFLLTTNHEAAEHCFVMTIDQSFTRKAVFRQWAPSWIKRTVMKNAIRSVFVESPGTNLRRDLWRVGTIEPSAEVVINAVTQLAALERFVFVMSILERYSNRDCSLLLSCPVERVIQMRTRALRRLPALDLLFILETAPASRPLELTARTQPSSQQRMTGLGRNQERHMRNCN